MSAFLDGLVTTAGKLTPDDIAKAAKILGVSSAHIRAVLAVESNGRGFHPETRRPIILFEPHIFSRRTAGKFNASAPAISYPKWGAMPYPATQAARWDQLGRAYDLAPRAALESASWGLFQIMGFNASACGFGTAEDFARAMATSEAEQLLAFARFIGGDAHKRDALRLGDWAGFARLYNGPAFASHGYDQKLKAAYVAARAAA